VFRKLTLLVLFAGLLTLVTVTLPAGAHVSGHRAVRDVDEPNLDDAYYSLEDAEWHEYNADDEMSSSTGCTGCAIAQLGNAVAHLEDALGEVTSAESVGEIAPDEALAIKSKLNNAIDADHRAAGLIESGQFGAAFNAFLEAESAKEAAEDLIAGYPLDGSVDLGCKLYLSSNPYPGDTAVGADGCNTPLKGIEVIGGYHFNRVSNVVIGSSEFPCDHRTWLISCDQSVQPGQPVYVSFDTSQEKTLNQFVARAVDGRVQVIPFTIGSAQPTADTGAVAKLFWATSRGFKPAVKLEQGSRYAYNVDVTNDGPGAAFDGTLQVTVPSTFGLENVSKKCTVSGTTIKCPLDSVRPYEGISASIVGRPTKPGPITFSWTVTTNAKQPTPDKKANSGLTKVVVYPVPLVKIKKISSSIKLGKPGTISGIGGVDVKKVQLGILQKTVNPAKVCKWLGQNGKLVSVAPYAGACDKGIWLDVKGALKWEFKLKLGLPGGSYYVLGRGTSTDGITGTLFKMSDWSLDQFKVK
jgi:hypothetical protein